MKYLHKKQIQDMDVEFQQRAEGGHTIAETRVHNANVSVRRAEQRRELARLVNRQAEQIRLTGVDPDAEARARRQVQLQQIDARRQAILLRHIGQIREVWRDNNAVHQVGIEAQPRGLAAFVADPQNVHTVEAVHQTKKIVDMIRKVPVPEEYRWNHDIVSKTPFEIGLACKLSPRAAWQMISQYAQTTAIYDIEEGIYGKVLDSVWQYMKNSPDKDDLCSIMKRELEDNIGMCAQGNLSRICNVLAGYMEGVGSQESLSERLGRLLAPLMDIEDNYERIRQACVILRDNQVHLDEWDIWMDPLFEEESTELYELVKEQLAV